MPEFSRRQYAYVGALAVAVLALLLDKLVLREKGPVSGPAQATAATASEPTRPPPPLPSGVRIPPPAGAGQDRPLHEPNLLEALSRIPVRTDDEAAHNDSLLGRLARRLFGLGGAESALAPGLAGARGETIRDLFAPSPAILARMLAAEQARQRAMEQPRPRQPARDAKRAAADFAASHELQAVFLGVPPHRVVINGQLVVCGQTIDGYRLVEVRPFEARLQRGPLSVTLRLPQTEP